MRCQVEASNLCQYLKRLQQTNLIPSTYTLHLGYRRDKVIDVPLSIEVLVEMKKFTCFVRTPDVQSYKQVSTQSCFCYSRKKLWDDFEWRSATFSSQILELKLESTASGDKKFFFQNKKKLTFVQCVLEASSDDWIKKTKNHSNLTEIKRTVNLNETENLNYTPRKLIFNVYRPPTFSVILK